MWKKGKSNSDKILKIWKKRKLNSDKIWKVWKKNKLNSEKIWKIRKKTYWILMENAVLKIIRRSLDFLTSQYPNQYIVYF